MPPHNVNKCLGKECAKTPTTVPVPRYTVEQLRELFRRCDSNRDGLLSRKELKAAFNELGAIFPGWRAHRALSHADENGDGYISEKEIDHLVDYAVELGYVVVK